MGSLWGKAAAVCLVALLGGCASQASGAPSARFSEPAVDDDGGVSLLDEPSASPTPPPSPSPSLSRSAKPKSSPSRPPSARPSSPASNALVVLGQAGPHSFVVAAGGTGIVGTGGKLLRYRVAVEKGLPESPAEVAATVDRVLDNQARGWLHSGGFRFQRVFAGPSDFIVELASPATTDDICARYGMHTGGQVSCRGQQDVVINSARWERGTNGTTEGKTTYPPAEYRVLAINHEVGHALGHGHVTCSAPGAPAAVMMPQYFGLDGCTQNIWPYGEDGGYVG